MNQQLKIKIDTSNNRTLEPLTLEPQYINGRAYPIASASGIVYGVSGAYNDVIAQFDTVGSLMITGNELNGLLYNWQLAEMALLTPIPTSSYRVYWTLNGGDRALDRWVDVVYWKMLNPTSEYDLLLEKPELEKHRPERSLMITTLSSGIALSCNTLYEASGFFDGSIISFKGGNNDGFNCLVDSWSSIAQQFTLAKPLPRPANQGDKFILRRSFKPEIDRAWLELQNTINSWVGDFVAQEPRTWMYPYMWGNALPTTNNHFESGKDLTWSVDGTDFNQMHLYKSMINVSKNLMTKEGDMFDVWRLYYEERYGVAFTELRAKIDTNKDGIYNGRDSRRDGDYMGSLESRITSQIVKCLDEIGLKHVDEMDFNSPRLSSDTAREEIAYYLLLQIYPITRGIPVYYLRLSFGIGIFSTQGQPPVAQNDKLMQAADAIWQTLMRQQNLNNLGVREFQRVNDATSIRGDLVVTLSEYQCKAFARKGEY